MYRRRPTGFDTGPPAGPPARTGGGERALPRNIGRVQRHSIYITNPPAAGTQGRTLITQTRLLPGQKAEEVIQSFGASLLALSQKLECVSGRAGIAVSHGVKHFATSKQIFSTTFSIA